jgi:hypothetical protein
VELALQRSVPVIHIDITRGSDEVRMRALVGGGVSDEIRDPHLYGRLLNEVFKLGSTAPQRVD